NDREVRAVSGPPSLVEGIGRPRVEASFLPDVVDRMIAVSDCCSIAATRVISARLGRLCGGSTGTNLWACARIATEMAAAGEKGSIVTILCDSGERYRTTYFNDDWLAAHGIDCRADEERFAGFLDSGALPD
ncbi:MAG: hypothetical protein KDA43_15200, partial [Hyphomonas sp.]|nr:hypothetical protein [Hyphomonas sp.]